MFLENSLTVRVLHHVLPTMYGFLERVKIFTDNFFLKKYPESAQNDCSPIRKTESIYIILFLQDYTEKKEKKDHIEKKKKKKEGLYCKDFGK